MLTAEQIEQYQRDGYYVAQNVFSPEEVEFYKRHFMEMRSKQAYPGDFAGVPVTPGPQTGDNYINDVADPLQQYPRMIHMHRWDDASLQWMIDKRLNEYMTGLLGSEPFAVQTMLYFKPAGARGQALHQDQYYLKVQPGTCMASWMALDNCDEENGCLQVIPGSHMWPLLCPTSADTSTSFTDVTVPIPEGVESVPIIMKAGDMMFFNGSLVHGSFPNTSKDRFRRSLIGHYIVGEAQQVSQFYHPVLRMDGTEVELDISAGGGSCGVWVDHDGQPVIEVAGDLGTPLKEHE
jgi:phytanoyl-CoA hydroxylase